VDREDAIEHLHSFIPRQIVAHHEQIAAVGTGQELRWIDDALMGV
jgi:hypothetical protein